MLPYQSPSSAEVTAYFSDAEKLAWKIDNLAPGTKERPINKVGIIGAGTMGGGIAMNFATAGISVRLIETVSENLERGLATIRRNYQRSADKGRFPVEEVENRMGRISGSLVMEDLADCDLVIEAVFEDMALKKKIFMALDKICKPGAILATNTSYLNIDEIASATSRPTEVIGLHFFSPANVMKLLEIVRAAQTTDDIVATAMGVAKKINKVGVLVGVCPGFVGNRILQARQVQALKLLYKGVMPWEVDAAFQAFGFRMGPFQMSDLAGLDIGWKKGATTQNLIRDRLCELDRRGQKTGAGYYDYDEKRKPSPSTVTAKIIAEVTGQEAVGSGSISAQDIIEACIFPMINVGVRLLEENKAQRPTDIDVVWLYGYGWPAERGGLMSFGDLVGADKVLAKMEELAAEDPEFAPAQTLKRLAAEGGKFTELETGGLKVG